MISLNQMNDTIFLFFYNFAHQSVLLDGTIIFLAVYLPFLTVALAAWYLVVDRKSLHQFILVFFSAGVAAVISKILKMLIHAPRPGIVLPDTQALFVKTSYAFPSDHATFFMALAVAMFFVNKKSGYVFIFSALLIGLSRVAAGVHFPVDILGGFILGGAVAFIIKSIWPEKVVV